MTSSGIAFRKCDSAACPTYVPVGLLGLAMKTTRVSDVMARAMAGRSCT
jgi:hypothetical protein